MVAFLAGAGFREVTGVSWPGGGMLLMGPHAGPHRTDDTGGDG